MLLLAIRNMDAAEYMTPYQPRPDDIWERWSFALEPPEVADAVVEPPWWERHQITPPHTSKVVMLSRICGAVRLPNPKVSHDCSLPDAGRR